MEQQKHISSKVNDVVSRLQEALKQSTYMSLAKSGKLVRWVDSASRVANPQVISSQVSIKGSLSLPRPIKSSQVSLANFTK
jgi:hypothetical protein